MACHNKQQLTQTIHKLSSAMSLYYWWLSNPSLFLDWFFKIFYFKLTLLVISVNTITQVSMYSSIILILYIVLCVHHPKSNPSPYIWPLYLLLPSPNPIPSGNHHTIVDEIYLFICLVCSFVLFYILRIRKIIWFLTYSIWLILLSIIFPKSILVVTMTIIMPQQCFVLCIGLAKNPFSFFHKIKDPFPSFTNNFIDLYILSM